MQGRCTKLNVLRKNAIITGRIFLIFAAIAGTVAAIIVGFYIKKCKTFDTVNAKIKEIYEQGCQIEYTYDGIEYVGSQYTTYSSSWRVGNTISIFVDPDDPNNFKLKEGSMIAVGVFSVFFLVFGTIGMTMYSIGKNGKMKINTNWNFIYAKVVNVIENPNARVNGISMLRVVCEYENPVTGKIEKFFSRNCLDDPGDVYVPDETIKVYVKDDTHKKYQVDLTKFYECGKR